MIVRESLINEQKKLNLSAGFVIVQDNRILLGHPTGDFWYSSYSIPKGHVEEGEGFLEAATRETKEEVGITIDPSEVVSGPHFVDYTDGKKIFKRVYYFVVHPSSEITKRDLKPQGSEIDWAGFLTREEAEKRISPRLKEVLKHLQD